MQQRPSSLLDIPQSRTHVLGELERRIIKPYFVLANQQDLIKAVLDASMLSGIEEQIKVKSCITSQVAFLIQSYLVLLAQKAQELKKPAEELFSELKVGIIGCGIIGKSILNALVFLLGWIPAGNIHISTRRPENLSKYEEIGFNIYFDNDKLVEQCDIMIWSFPPSLDNWAAAEVKNALKQRVANSTKLLKPLIISVVSNLYIPKLEKLLLVSNIFTRSHIANKDQLQDEESFGQSLYSDNKLIIETLNTFQAIFKEFKGKQQPFDINSIDSTIRSAILGSNTTSFDDAESLISEAKKHYVSQMGIFKQTLSEIIHSSASSQPATEQKQALEHSDIASDV